MISMFEVTEWSGVWAVGNACVAKRSKTQAQHLPSLVQHSHSINSGAPLSLWFKENGSYYHKPFFLQLLGSPIQT